jgi:hypothetical protein
MAKFISEVVGIGQADLISSATQIHPLGTRAVDDSGRVFRYAKAGATLVAGNVLQSPAIVPNHLAMTAPVVAIGAKSFTCTPGATLGAADLYADGFLDVSVTPGEGYTYGVAGHAAFASATAFTLNLKDPIQVAFTTGTRLGLLQNKYRGVIQLPVTTATGTVVGISTYIITSGQFGWIGTWGTFSVLCTGTPALGAMVLGPGTTAGAAQVVVAAGNLIVGQVIGHMAQVAVNGEWNFVEVRINP